MPFKIPKTAEFSTESPEALFRDLRTRKVAGLLAHQADILRDYSDQAVDKPDVAFELPTGSGKTLVGLLLAEWRRRRFGERCVYLCPTNQLVNQVAEQAVNQYGIAATAFTGRKTDYPPQAQSHYLNGETVAITSYKALFNSHPYFEDPGTIILDDVHSAENNIASYWSLRIQRHEHPALYTALLSILKNVLAPTDYQTLADTKSGNWDIIEKIPTPELVPLIPELVTVLNAHAHDTDLMFPWQALRGQFEACHLYIRVNEILLRPLIPPTNTHTPFRDAKQRIYMSATLGEGGDLERLTGRKSITRLKVPTGWDKQGLGRRLFFFPGHTLGTQERTTLILDMIRTAGRALILVPDRKAGEKIGELVRTETGFDVFDAYDIESSKKPFVEAEQAVAVIANRYDGIDLVGDECRLLIVIGLSRATNLQEQFIISKMGAGALLSDRIMTRTVQAFGRCTRSATDYAAVVVIGEELDRFLLNKQQRSFLHPELQSELEFGIEQAKNATTPQGFLEYLHSFLAQDSSWQDAENYIVTQRDTLQRESPPGTQCLRNSVNDELYYQYAMWNGDYVEGLNACRRVLAQLTDEKLRGYRALWNYLAGSAAWLSHRDSMTKDGLSYKEYFSNAQKASGATIRWLARLSRTIDPSVIAAPTELNTRALALIERLEMVLAKYGTRHDRLYAQEEKYILENLKTGDSSKFEDAHKRLGMLLGFEAGNQETTGAPDPWWIVDENLCFIFEDHSDGDPNSSLNTNKARQVATHPNWVRSNLSLSKDARIVPVLVTPVKFADADAVPHLEQVYVWDIEAFCLWASKALSVVRSLRSIFPGSGDLDWRAKAVDEYRHNEIEPESFITMLQAQPRLGPRAR